MEEHGLISGETDLNTVRDNKKQSYLKDRNSKRDVREIPVIVNLKEKLLWHIFFERQRIRKNRLDWHIKVYLTEVRLRRWTN